MRDALVVAPAQIGRPASDQWLGLWRYSPARAEPAAVTVALRFEHSATVPIVVPIVVLVLGRVPMVVLSRAPMVVLGRVPMVVLVLVLVRVPMVVLGRVPMVSSSASASPSSS